MSRKLNPMYIFSAEERELLLRHYFAHQPDNNAAVYDIANFGTPEDRVQNIRLFQRFNRSSSQMLVLSLRVESTLKIPHHIHEDASMEIMQDRAGPIRTYFDGSSLHSLGHVIAIGIDKHTNRMTTKCSKGNELSDYHKSLLMHHFPDYEYVTIREKQQTDEHSCVAYTLYNMLVFAGLKPAGDVDIMAWRTELLDTIEAIGRNPNTTTDDDLAMKRIGRYRRSGPVFTQPYI